MFKMLKIRKFDQIIRANFYESVDDWSSMERLMVKESIVEIESYYLAKLHKNRRCNEEYISSICLCSSLLEYNDNKMFYFISINERGKKKEEKRDC